MSKTASPYCLYEEGEVIDNAERTVFERKVDREIYSGYKAMDWSEIWRGKLLRYTDAIGSGIY